MAAIPAAISCAIPGAIFRAISRNAPRWGWGPLRDVSRSGDRATALAEAARKSVVAVTGEQARLRTAWRDVPGILAVRRHHRARDTLKFFCGKFGVTL